MEVAKEVRELVIANKKASFLKAGFKVSLDTCKLLPS